MKTLHKFLIAGLVSGLAPLAFAGSGSQYWQTPKPAAAQESAHAGAACIHMLVPNTGPTASRVPLVSVSCTAEMAKADPRCQSHCGLSTPGKETRSTGITCDHMLIRNKIGNGYRSPSFISVKCTPEMLKNNPECQSACRGNS